MPTYKDYPRVHAFLAGDAAENNIPFNAFEMVADMEVATDHVEIFKLAEEFLNDTLMTKDQLYEAGYETATGMCLDAPDTCISDLPQKEQEVELAKLHEKYGVNHSSIYALICAIY
jgi:hypothetical protein